MVWTPFDGRVGCDGPMPTWCWSWLYQLKICSQWAVASPRSANRFGESGRYCIVFNARSRLEARPACSTRGGGVVSLPNEGRDRSMSRVSLAALVETIREIGELDSDPDLGETLVDLEIDSLGVTRLIFALEELLGAPLPDGYLNLEVFESVGSLWAALERLDNAAL